MLSDDVIQKIERTLNNTDTTTEKRTKNGLRKSKKQSKVLSNSGYKPWYYATLLRIWGWTFKGCKQTDPTPSFFSCDYEYSWRIRKSQTHRDAESLVKKLRKKIENSRLIKAFVTHYKSFRDPEIGENVSYRLKAMVAKNQLRAFTPRYGYSCPERPLSGSGGENTVWSGPYACAPYHYNGREVKKESS